MTNFEKLCQELESEIEQVYTNGITMEDAEKLAAKFLSAQLKVSAELKKVDLDSRMRRSGVKAVRGAAYLNILKTNEKKPTESAIDSMINTDSTVSAEQDAYDKAEVLKSELERYYDIFNNGHIYARGIAKGNFSG